MATQNPTTSVWVTFQLEGWHHWPDAPAVVGYLASRHRHMFHYRVEVAVGHADRQLEFHQMLNDLVPMAQLHLYTQSTSSCEQLALDLGKQMQDNDIPVLSITVSEDGENGATVRWSL